MGGLGRILSWSSHILFRICVYDKRGRRLKHPQRFLAGIIEDDPHLGDEKFEKVWGKEGKTDAGDTLEWGHLWDSQIEASWQEAGN